MEAFLRVHYKKLLIILLVIAAVVTWNQKMKDKCSDVFDCPVVCFVENNLENHVFEMKNCAGLPDTPVYLKHWGTLHTGNKEIVYLNRDNYMCACPADTPGIPYRGKIYAYHMPILTTFHDMFLFVEMLIICLILFDKFLCCLTAKFESRRRPKI